VQVRRVQRGQPPGDIVGYAVQNGFAGGGHHHVGDGFDTALRDGVEKAQGVDFIPPEFDTDRPIVLNGVNVENATTVAVLPWHGDGRHMFVAHGVERSEHERQRHSLPHLVAAHIAAKVLRRHGRLRQRVRECQAAERWRWRQ